MEYTLLQGDVIEQLKTLPANSVQCCVTSPPYWGLRDYGTAKWEGGDEGCSHVMPAGTTRGGPHSTLTGGQDLQAHKTQYRDTCLKCGARRIDNQIGLEPTPAAYVAKMVAVFDEVRRVLRPDGVLWLNLGDSYNGSGKGDGGMVQQSNRGSMINHRTNLDTLKPKDLCGIPWLVAKALQEPRYIGRIKEERDRVWLAATIDAEGTICGFTHERKDNGDIRRGIHVTITNSNIKMLDNAYRIWETSKQEHNSHGRGHYGKLDTYRWIAHGLEEKQQLLAELYPYLVCKKTQALLAWNFLEISKQARGRNKGQEGDTNREKCAWIVAALSELNHLRDVDIPAWIVEPPTQYQQGWWLRSDIIWAKPNPMPESVKDRPTRSHEYVFLMTKSARYYYDAEAIREDNAGNLPYGDKYTFKMTEDAAQGRHGKSSMFNGGTKEDYTERYYMNGRNARDVWTMNTGSFDGAHFATFPVELPERCIKASTSAHGCCEKCGAPWERVTEKTNPRLADESYMQKVATPKMAAGAGIGRNDYGTNKTGLAKAGWRELPPATNTLIGWQPTCTCNADVVPCTVLDPFSGSGTTVAVAMNLGRVGIGIELNPQYIELAHRRIRGTQPALIGV